MPILACKICKNKIAAFIAAVLVAFNPNLLYYTQRIKQYSTDVLITIILIYAGAVFFEKPFSKNRMVIFTIFIIPWLFIFIPYIINVCGQTINNLMFWWKDVSFLTYFDDFKRLTCYLLGNAQIFHYLFIPMITGVLFIFIKKDRYLFSTLILPIVTAQIIGILYIYPLSSERFCLWLTPIFVILFILPFKYINIKSKIIFYILSVVLVIYYSFMFDKSSFVSIKNLLDGAYNYKQDKFHLVIETLKQSDIKKGDYILINCPTIITFFDFDKNFSENQIFSIDYGTDNIYEELTNENVYFYLDKNDTNFTNQYQWIHDNMNSIIYEFEDRGSGILIKARKN